MDDKELLFVQAEVFLMEGDYAMVDTILARLSRFAASFTMEEEDKFADLLADKAVGEMFYGDEDEWT